MNKSVIVNKHQQGMALFQVLLLTSVIAVLAIQFTQTAKNQVSIATTLSNRAQASVEMKTAEAKLLFSLLTEHKYKHVAPNNDIVRQWNFHGEPFSPTTRIEYSIQDQNGLIGLFRNNDYAGLSSAFAVLGVEKPEVIAAKIIDWQDHDSLISINGAEKGDYELVGSPSNLPFQTYQEIKYILEGMGEDWAKIAPYVSIRPQSYINPKLAPKPLLALHLPANQVDKIIELRDKNQLSDQYFSRISGLYPDEGIFFAASDLLRVVIKVKVEDVVFTQRMELSVNPYAAHPFIEYEKTI